MEKNKFILKASKKRLILKAYNITKTMIINNYI